MCIHWFFSLIWFLLVCFSYRVISFHFMFSLLLSLWFLIVFPLMFIVYMMGFSVLLLCSLEDPLPLCVSAEGSLLGLEDHSWVAFPKFVSLYLSSLLLLLLVLKLLSAFRLFFHLVVVLGCILLIMFLLSYFINIYLINFSCLFNHRYWCFPLLW
jgi:hypothetical protein